MIRSKVMVSTDITMEQYSKVIGSMIPSKEMAFIFSKIKRNMKDSLETANHMELGYIHIKMETLTKE